MNWGELFTRTILVVSGKGGTGKSSVAAALATAASAGGKRVLLAEVEGRGEIERTLGVPGPGFEERTAPQGFRALSITPREAALEYLHLFFGMDRATRLLVRTGALDQVIAGAPGFRDLLICGKLYEIAHVRRTNRRDRGRPEYDLVVVDGPPTGQIAPFLAAPATFAELIRVGRMRHQAEAIGRMLRRLAGVVLVAIPEEMAVAETLEAVPALRRAGVPLAAVVANRTLPAVFPRGTRRAFDDLTDPDLVRVAREAGLTLDMKEAAELRAHAELRQARHLEQARWQRSLRQTGAMLTLREVPGGRGVRLVGELARQITEGAAAHGAAPAAARAEVEVELPRPSSRSTAGTDRAGVDDWSPAGSLDQPLRGARLIVVCGSGGVGKTTVSAAIAVNLAEAGNRTALLTVDPARRLATALRLPLLAGERTEVLLGRGRRMEALQLDTQRTFDELIERHAGSAERRDRILGNRFYQRIADTLAGTNEYMAMEKLHELAEEQVHDAIVIDTPPTRTALSFLDAPNRLTEFLGGRFLRWMLWPSAKAGRFALAAARLGTTTFVRTAGRLVGAETLADTTEFLAAFEGMYGGFKRRAAAVVELLRSPACAFVVVTTPTEPSLAEAGFFLDRLSEGGMRPAAVVANRWHPRIRALPPGAAAAANRLGGGNADRRGVAAVVMDRLAHQPQLDSEAAAMSSFRAAHPAIPIVGVPELPGDIHDVPGLRRLGGYLFGDGSGFASDPMRLRR